jgi:putative hydrolase of the HAD superfamily
MMKYLFPEIEWSKIKAVGFDMDGTLYDEFDFIQQAYKVISTNFEKENKSDYCLLDFMLSRWLEKGSSYPYIFKETLDLALIPENSKENLIQDALHVFRTFQPDISLSPRIEFFLKIFSKEYEIFIITDGSSQLQLNKIKSLKLDRFVSKNNIFISGNHGKGNEKPSLYSLNYISALKKSYTSEQIVFIGDRKNDSEFALKAGFQFIHAKNLLYKNE